jgi:hypothetical protein
MMSNITNFGQCTTSHRAQKEGLPPDGALLTTLMMTASRQGEYALALQVRVYVCAGVCVCAGVY